MITLNGIAVTRWLYREGRMFIVLLADGTRVAANLNQFGAEGGADQVVRESRRAGL
jgi:hypothetical protein